MCSVADEDEMEGSSSPFLKKVSGPSEIGVSFSIMAAKGLRLNFPLLGDILKVDNCSVLLSYRGVSGKRLERCLEERDMEGAEERERIALGILRSLRIVRER
ncbi:hypothetical protein AMTR_s00009p00234850 [Amborella trichopoda]|uniref:Uncharacterized protein n=1 Tax=Amborella trichopoda TaxID=13333 RepID=W1NIF3_AMBTC|nr:hypothetical protein AMTR_s00009p00234850 [Amborella trichopoda]